MQENEKYFTNWKVPKAQSKEASWDAIQQKIAEKETKIIPLFGRKWMGIAASLALLIALVFMTQSSDTQNYVALEQERNLVNLPDGSRIHLNAGSEVSFDADNWSEAREVTLKGEAFFEVEKGSKFSVITNLGSVEVLGTSFNVFDRGESFYVSCKTGRVRVSNSSSSEILTPGLKTTLHEGTLMDAFECSEENIAMWMDKELYHFDNVSLKSAFDELERQFGIEINSDQIETSSLVNADIPLEDVEIALNILTTAFDLNYSKNTDKKYIVTK
ncbi:MAG: FecR family protein [Bacteroidota bacterium]